MPRIGYLILSPLADPPSAERQAFLNGLRDLGYLPEVAGKRLALVKEALPKVSRVGVLWNPASESVQPDWQGTQTAAGVLGTTLQSLEVRDPKDFPSAFAAMARRRPDALIIFFSPLMRAYRPIIVELATKNRLPTMLGERADVEEGGLMSYSPSAADSFRRAAYHARDRVAPGWVTIREGTMSMLVWFSKVAGGRLWWQRTCTALLWITLGGCATVPTPATWQPGNLQPLISGWPQYFEILWVVTRQDQGAFIEGYITNTWGFAVREVRVLVNGYDASGTQTGQVIAWGPNAIQPGERVYFDMTVPAAAATYDVSIFSWNWTWPPSGRHEEESWSTKRAGNDRSPVLLTPASALTVPAPWTVAAAGELMRAIKLEENTERLDLSTDE